jgi:Helix-turn-helix of DDE superfamily endonuclease
MSGLDSAQLDELEQMVSELLEEPWDKGEGRPRELNLREALIVTCGYLRQNIIEDVWAEIFDVAQSTISRYITFLTPLVEKATDEGRPTAADAAEATRGAIALVDGTLWPCWSWDGERELWSGKYKTTGHGSLIVRIRKSCERVCQQPTWRFLAVTPVTVLLARVLSAGRGLCPGAVVFGAGVPRQEPFQRRP